MFSSNIYIHNDYFFVPWVLVGEYELVAAQKECDGSETFMVQSSLHNCASFCYGKSTMFAYGTNDFGNNRCGGANYAGGCQCLCETAALAGGTCTQTANTGYRLYKYS